MGMDLGCIRDVSGNSKGVWALARAQIYIVVVYMTISIIGAWQVFANTGITFERIDIF